MVSSLPRKSQARESAFESTFGLRNNQYGKIVEIMPITLCSIRLLMGLIALVFTACSTLPRNIEPPRMNIVNIAPKDIAIFEQRYDVQLRIQNPNDADLGIKGLRFDIELNDQQFAS